MSKLIVIIGLCAFLMFTNSYAENVSHQTNTYLTDLNEAVSIAIETKQDIVIIFSSDDCMYCDMLYTDFKDLKNLHNKVVCILNTKGEKQIIKKFKIRGFPTTIILSYEGEELTRFVGYKKTKYQNWLNNN